jgi:dTDP-4-dehydrorhamnose 3,5-epimerase-like enzyme
MKANGTALQRVPIVEPDAFPDKRGYLMEPCHEEKYDQLGSRAPFVQANLSYSVLGALRHLY